MGEYFRESNNKIQAGFALNTGKLLAQYRSLTKDLPPDRKYEATLTVCALQALLTHCTELINAMRKHQHGFWSEPITDIPGHWGVRRSFVQTNNFTNELTYSKFVTHLRNALSHPTSPDKSPNHPTTGYTTVPDGKGAIVRFRFTDSPWVDRGRIHSRAFNQTKEKVEGTLTSHLNTKNIPGYFAIRPDGEKWRVYKDDKIYLPIFVAELPLAALTELAIALANHLSQPAVEHWDGVTIERNVA